MNDVPNDCFFVDATPSTYPFAQFSQGHPSLYDQFPGAALGAGKDESPASLGKDLRLCFNCGSPDHAVASCPEPINRQLVSLSRQLFNFFHPESTGQEAARFYIAEGWKQQRLEWTRSFEPGVIRGPLRDALGLQEGDRGDTAEWLWNMAYWGYPPGWVSYRDPRELIYSLILDGSDEGQGTASDEEAFTIFEGADDDEQLDLTICSPGWSSIPQSAASRSVDVEPTRWAMYPDTYFSPTALSIYNGDPLGRVDSSPSRVSATFTPERRALWESMLYGGLGTITTSSVPPWRLPGTLTMSKELAPPPPSTTPPPLPPAPVPRPPAFIVQKGSMLSKAPTPSGTSGTDDRSVVDMDVSDDSE